ncbi:MG284/MPN403 family protein [Mycoplasma sp. 48589B]
MKKRNEEQKPVKKKPGNFTIEVANASTNTYFFNNELTKIGKLADAGDLDSLKQLYDSNGLNLKVLYDAIENIIKCIIKVKKESNSDIKKRLALLWIQYINTQDPEIKQLIDEIETNLRKTHNIFNYILAMMSPENSWIIHKTYIDPETSNNKHWYIAHFSKTTFYKKKHNAILEFGKYLLQLDYD